MAAATQEMVDKQKTKDWAKGAVRELSSFWVKQVSPLLTVLDLKLKDESFSEEKSQFECSF